MRAFAAAESRAHENTPISVKSFVFEPRKDFEEGNLPSLDAACGSAVRTKHVSSQFSGLSIFSSPVKVEAFTKNAGAKTRNLTENHLF